jgi:next-to-BRCA1 protein 1
MLRFSIFNETPHKLPSGFVPDNTPATGASNPFISLSHIPPPPVILSSTAASTPQAPMDIDCWTPDQSQSTLPSSSSTPKPQHQQRPQSESSCCAVSQGKLEMQEIVSKFKQDLDRILQSSLGTPEPMTPLAPLPVHKDMFPGPPSSFCLFKYCTTCAKIFQGPWFACEKCSIVVVRISLIPHVIILSVETVYRLPRDPQHTLLRGCNGTPHHEEGALRCVPRRCACCQPYSP